MPPVERRLEKSSEKLLANGFAALPSDSMRVSSGWALTSPLPIFPEEAPRLLKNCVVARRERSDVVERTVDARCGDAKVVEGRGRLFGERFEVLKVGAHLTHEGREFVQVGGQRGAMASGRFVDGGALRDEFGELLAFARERHQRPVAFFGEVAEHLVLRGEGPE